MPRKKKSDVPPTQTAAVPKIPEELLDQPITGPITQDQFQVDLWRAEEGDLRTHCIYSAHREQGFHGYVNTDSSGT